VRYLGTAVTVAEIKAALARERVALAELEEDGVGGSFGAEMCRLRIAFMELWLAVLRGEE